MLELGEDLLNRIEVGRVFRQEQQLGAGRADGHRSLLERSEQCRKSDSDLSEPAHDVRFGEGARIA
jgi:hypothetical protein